ncbi:MAG TPA: hypothetical protein VFJ15_02790 [Oleiagrimonas sp.]|nr:hypothetical protein [Oleiagrimonas sp.]
MYTLTIAEMDVVYGGQIRNLPGTVTNAVYYNFFSTSMAFFMVGGSPGVDLTGMYDSISPEDTSSGSCECDSNPSADTTGGRGAIVDEAGHILNDLGFYAPPGTSVTYVDKYAFINDNTDAIRWSNTYNPKSYESDSDGYTNRDGEIVIARNNMNSQGTGLAFDHYYWGELRATGNGEIDVGGTDEVAVNQSYGLTYLESTIATLAYEYYHANVIFHEGGHRTGSASDLEEERARTQGYLAEKAFEKADQDGSLDCAC